MHEGSLWGFLIFLIEEERKPDTEKDIEKENDWDTQIHRERERKKKEWKRENETTE